MDADEASGAKASGGRPPMDADEVSGTEGSGCRPALDADEASSAEASGCRPAMGAVFMQTRPAAPRQVAPLPTSAPQIY